MVIVPPLLLFYLSKISNIRKLEIVGLAYLAIMLGLRYEFGPDYPAYYIIYNTITLDNGDWHQYIEPVYFYLNVLFGALSFNAMLFFIAIVSLSLWYTRIKYENNRTLILFIFLLYSQSFFMQQWAIRQGMAAMIFFFAIEFINQRNFKKTKGR